MHSLLCIPSFLFNDTILAESQCRLGPDILHLAFSGGRKPQALLWGPPMNQGEPTDLQSWGQGRGRVPMGYVEAGQGLRWECMPATCFR